MWGCCAHVFAMGGGGRQTFGLHVEHKMLLSLFAHAVQIWPDAILH